MKKETLKTIVLVFLVLSSIVLTVNNWFSEKLWPDGYNFFSNLTNYFSDDEIQKSYFLSKENVSNPTSIIVNNIESRGVYTHTSDDYNDMVGPVKEILKSGLSEKNSSPASPDLWKEALKYKSIYLSYPVSYGIKTFSAVMDTPVTVMENGSVQEFVIVSGDPITGKPRLLIKNSTDNTYIDVAISVDVTKIDGLIEKYAKNSVGEYPYSFELNFDKTEDGMKQKVVIEPQVTLAINPVSANTVSETNYFEDIAFTPSLYNKFLKAFDFNTSNIRKNVNIDDSIVFAENYGSIKMYPDGLLEYKSLDDTKGIVIGNSTQFYTNFIDCIEFINNVWDTACHDKNMNINISSAKITDNDNSFILTINYFADGMEVVTTLDKTDSHDKMDSAIEVEVKNSKIVSYKQIVKGYEANDDEVQCISVIEALDVLMANENVKSETISDLYLAYYPDENGLCTPCWVARTAGNEIRIIKNKQD